MCRGRGRFTTHHSNRQVCGGPQGPSPTPFATSQPPISAPGSSPDTQLSPAAGAQVVPLDYFAPFSPQVCMCPPPFGMDQGLRWECWFTRKGLKTSTSLSSPGDASTRGTKMRGCDLRVFSSGSCWEVPSRKVVQAEGVVLPGPSDWPQAEMQAAPRWPWGLLQSCWGHGVACQVGLSCPESAPRFRVILAA